MRLALSAEEAAQEIAQFYRNYHSSRWLKDRFVIRLNHSLSEAALESISQTFGDISLNGEFIQQPGCEAEQDEPELRQLSRLAFTFNGRDQGRLRELLDFINLPQHWA